MDAAARLECQWRCAAKWTCTAALGLPRCHSLGGLGARAHGARAPLPDGPMTAAISDGLK